MFISKKAIIIGAVAMVLIAAVVIGTTSFSSAVHGDEAKDIAKAYVPDTAEFAGSEEEDRYFEVAFYDEEHRESFEVEVNKETGEVKKVESQLDDDDGGKEIVLTEEDAKKVVKDRFDGITSITADLMKDDGLYVYEVSFKSDEFYGDALVNGETGAILESVMKYGTLLTIPMGEPDEKGMITYDEAKNLVLEKAGEGEVKDIDLEGENDNFFYEVELRLDGVERDYIVDAKTGEVTLENEHKSYFTGDVHKENHEQSTEYVDNSVETEDNFSETDKKETFEEENSSAEESTELSVSEAKEIVWAKVPGAEIIEFYLEHDDGIREYEGTAIADGYEYEFEINAATGVIISWDKESLDDDDDDDDD